MKTYLYICYYFLENFVFNIYFFRQKKLRRRIKRLVIPSPYKYLPFILYLMNLYKFFFRRNLCRYQAIFLYRVLKAIGCQVKLILEYIPQQGIFHLRVESFYHGQPFFCQPNRKDNKFITYL